MASTNTDVNSWPNDNFEDRVAHLRPLLDAISNHGPIFRRELFDAAYAAFLELDEDDVEEPADETRYSFLRNEATLLDVYGAPHQIRVLKRGPLVERDGELPEYERAWIYSCLQTLSYKFVDSEPEGLIPFSFGLVSHGGKQSRCLASDNVLKDVVTWKKEWEASEIHRQLCDFLENEVGEGKTRRVDKIICFACACPLSGWELTRRRSYVQHLAANTIRDIIARKQSGQKPSIYAQEPAYCPEAVAYLQKEFDITAIDDPEGFKCLDGNTFVISVAPNVPVRQIVVDMTFDTEGPAGMLCDAIDTEWIDFDGQEELSDKVKKVVWYTTDPGSAALSKYKQKSVAIECSDEKAEGFFGAMGLYMKKAD